MDNANQQPMPQQDDYWCLERVSGPHRGHFFAGYSRQSPNGFLAFVKIFNHEPATVWDSAARAKVSAHGARSHGAALRLAESRAMAWIEQTQGPETVDFALP